MSPSTEYRGRFAPSPTGPLHLGSLLTAVGSYLDARHHKGKWLVRIEDLDTPRTVECAASDILRTLEAYGLQWDEDIIYQSERTAAYESTFDRLIETEAVYRCACSRKEIADSALHVIEGQIYPGTCRKGISSGREGRAWRLRTDLDLPPRILPIADKGIHIENGVIHFGDVLQGSILQNLENEVGDFVVRRTDGLFSYQLAVIIDDAEQNITHVVRGADLLYSTPRQIYLQLLLGLPTPTYMHLPVVVNAQHEKLSKQTLAQPIKKYQAVTTLIQTLVLLHQRPPVELQLGSIEEILDWAIANWRTESLLNCRQIAL